MSLRPAVKRYGITGYYNADPATSFFRCRIDPYDQSVP